LHLVAFDMDCSSFQAKTLAKRKGKSSLINLFSFAINGKITYVIHIQKCMYTQYDLNDYFKLYTHRLIHDGLHDIYCPV